MSAGEDGGRSAVTPLPPSDACVVGASGELDAALRAVMTDPARPLASLAVLTVEDGLVPYTGSFGSRRISAESPAGDLPAGPHTKFRVASISKLVAATSVLQQVERGHVDLDADVSAYLGFTLRNPSFPDALVTARMLLSHTSSLRDGESYTFPAPERLSDHLAAGDTKAGDRSHWATPTAAAGDVGPGRYFCYQNLNYGVLATILEAVSGERFDAYVREHVLVPLGCEASFDVRDFSPQALQDLAVLYRKDDGEGTWDEAGPWRAQIDDLRGVRPPEPEGAAAYVPGTNATWQSPQGGLRISAWDLSKVMRMFLDRGVFHGARILQPETVDLMFTPQWVYDGLHPNGDTYGDLMLCYGLGPQIMTDTLGDRLLAGKAVTMAGHFGDANGLLSAMMMDFAGRRGFVYLIGGVGADPERQPGSYSSMSRWEEEIVTAVFRYDLRRD